MKRYEVTLTGARASMIMHWDSVRNADLVKRWREDHKRDKAVLKGDDRYPSWTWKTYLYIGETDRVVCIPTPNIQSCLMKGGVEFDLKGSKRKSLKAATQSMLRFEEPELPLHLSHPKGKVVTYEDIQSIDDGMSFEEQSAAAADLGIILDVRRVPVGQSKHIRTRPKFSAGWWVKGTLVNLYPDKIPDEQIVQLFDYCGKFVGLGDWRPSSPKTPGPHGQFDSSIKVLKD